VTLRTLLDKTPIDARATIQLLIATGHADGVLALDTAAPDVSLTPSRELAACLARAVRRHPARAASYAFPPGHLGLRRAVARRLLDGGCTVSPDDVVITTGATEALLLAFHATTHPGGTVVVETPTYYGALQVLARLGVDVVEIPGAPDRLRASALERALSAHRVDAVFLMPNFANPTGTRIPERDLADIVALLARAKIPLIEDDVNRELGFERDRPRAAKAFDRTGRVLLCGSVSKTLAPGLRVGWIVPGAAMNDVMALQWTTTISACSSAQVAVAEYFESTAYDRHLRELRTMIAENVARITREVERSFPSETRVTVPRGGLVMWIELPSTVDAVALHGDALRHGIAVMPGTLFSARGTHRHHVRLSCALPWSRRMQVAIAKIGALAARSRHR
jgi:DNA-binding transcriptional MocR family regulator